ncbi:MAG: hypothetical protein KIT84_11860 [Labilithrix sp.]|nr:hypothetical protein [Labilithrix sp.]MCW5811706.1 hypothetical protein [Labilithrix sp.]
MTEERELEVWRAEWAALGGRDDLAKTLAARVVKDGRRIKRGVAGEVAAAMLAASFSLWMAIASNGRPGAVVLCAGIFLFSGVWLTRLFTLREGARMAEGLEGFVALTRKRLADDMRWNAFSWRATFVVGVAATAWAIWTLVAGWSFYRAEPWRGVVGFGGIYVILAAVAVGMRVRRRKIAAEAERFEALVADALIEAGDEGAKRDEHA